MMLMARFATLFREYDIRHQVRDLHALQLGRGLVPAALRTVERLLLRKVSKVIVSSPMFASEYYESRFGGEIVLLENVPQESVWRDFVREQQSDGDFLVGYVGILRYKDALYKLIESVERLVREGFPIRVLFAGGASPENLADVKAKITIREAFEFSGPYEYSKDITRLYKNVDLIYAVYDEFNRNCQLAMPNKFYESILSGIPILVANNTFVGKQIQKYGIGEVVSVKDQDGLSQLLRQAFETESWYSRASGVLRQMSASELYADYERSLAASVL